MSHVPPPERMHFMAKLMPDSTDTTLDLLVQNEGKLTRVRINKESESLGLWKGREVGEEFDVRIPKPVARACGLIGKDE